MCVLSFCVFVLCCDKKGNGDLNVCCVCCGRCGCVFCCVCVMDVECDKENVYCVVDGKLCDVVMCGVCGDGENDCDG